MKGLDQLHSKLDSIVSQTHAAAAQSTAVSAQEVVALAKAYCPVETGELRESITVLSQRRTVSSAGVTVGSTSGHALPVEFGTSNMQAEPYLRPAIHNKRPSFLADTRVRIRSDVSTFQ